MERLEHFLEREYHLTQDCAGIGQDPGLMGRVGRVVLCGERDGVLFRGMSLNQICLELDGEILACKRGIVISCYMKQCTLEGAVCLKNRDMFHCHIFTFLHSTLPLPPPPSAVMSGNSADSYSEGESEGEQVKEKPEAPIAPAAPDPAPTLLYVRKGKNNGRVGRPKKVRSNQPPLPPPPPPLVHRRRGSGLHKSELATHHGHFILQLQENGKMFVS